MSEILPLDLSSALPLSSFVLELKMPGTDRPSGWSIELAGPSHEQTIALNNIVGRETIEQEAAILQAQVNGRKYKADVDPVDARRRKNVGRVCRRIIGWTPAPIFKNVSPDPIPFSLAAATDLFLRQDMAGFFVQVTDYLNGERAFMQPLEPI